MDTLVTTEWLAGEVGADDLRVFDCTVFLRRAEDGSAYAIESGRATFDEGHIPDSGFIDQVDELSDLESTLRFTALDPDRGR